MNPFFYHSTAYEGVIALPASAHCKLVDLICHVKTGGGNVFLLLYDNSTSATPGSDNWTPVGSSAVLNWTGSNFSWTTGTKVRLSSTDTVDSAFVANTDYWMRTYGTDGDRCTLHPTLADALADTNAIVAHDDCVGIESIHVLDWLEFSPMPISDGATDGPDWDALVGREFKDGITAVLSTSDTAAVPAGNVGWFDAVYTR